MSAPETWRPIETAPKDGRFILAYQPKEDALPPDPEVAVVQWFEPRWPRFEEQPELGEDIFRRVIDTSEGYWSGGPCDPWRATHWMPLPPPPPEAP